MFSCSGNGTKPWVQADSGVARSAVQVVAGMSLARWKGLGTELGTGFQDGLFYLPFLKAGMDLCALGCPLHALLCDCKPSFWARPGL